MNNIQSEDAAVFKGDGIPSGKLENGLITYHLEQRILRVKRGLTKISFIINIQLKLKTSI